MIQQIVLQIQVSPSKRLEHRYRGDHQPVSSTKLCKRLVTS